MCVNFTLNYDQHVNTHNLLRFVNSFNNCSQQTEDFFDYLPRLRQAQYCIVQPELKMRERVMLCLLSSWKPLNTLR